MRLQTAQLHLITKSRQVVDFAMWQNELADFLRLTYFTSAAISISTSGLSLKEDPTPF